jgi:hypothetical protein
MTLAKRKTHPTLNGLLAMPARLLRSLGAPKWPIVADLGDGAANLPERRLVQQYRFKVERIDAMMMQTST